MMKEFDDIHKNYLTIFCMYHIIIQSLQQYLNHIEIKFMLELHPFELIFAIVFDIYFYNFQPYHQEMHHFEYHDYISYISF